MSSLSTADLSDNELVRKTRSGDKEAYGELVTRYQGHVYGLTYSLVNNWADAQDITQETFIRAYCNLDQLRDPAQFAAWLRRVTFSVAMNWLKAFRPRLFEQLDSLEDIDSLGIPDFAPDPSEVVEKRELADAVLRAVASLPPKYRIPLTMFHLDGLSYQKVAEFLDIPLGTAKALIHRARQKLIPALSAYAVEYGIGSMVQEVFNEYKLPPEFARKVLEGVEKLRWGQGRECTFIGALTVAMRAIGEEVTYDYLMGVSGAAFRLQFHQPNWDNSSADVLSGFDHAVSALEALGYSADWHRADEDELESVEKTREAIIRSIDKGYPVVAQNLLVAMDWGIITGYQEGGKEFLGRTYWDQKEGYSQAENWPWCVLIFGEKGKPLDRRESLLRSLEIAVELATTERFGNYTSGFAAYEQWSEDLIDDSKFEKKQLRGMACCNGWCYFSLEDARRAAARYLRDSAEELDTGSAIHLSKTADLYEDVLAKLEEGRKYVFDLGRWENGEPWTQEIRQAQSAVLKEALALERKAIDELKAVLKTAGRRD